MSETYPQHFELTENQKASLMEQLGVLPHELEELFNEDQPHGPLTPKTWIHKEEPRGSKEEGRDEDDRER